MNYKKILKFIDKCLDLLKQEPKKEEGHKIYLFCERGVALSLMIYADWDSLLKKYCWEIASPAESYKIDHCGHCKSEDPCDRHQEHKTQILNAQTIHDARRANQLGLNVDIPEPIYPIVTRGFRTLQEFQELTKNIFPIFYEKVGWTFPPLKEGLKWNTTRINYPNIKGYSQDSKTTYKRGFYRVSEGRIFMHELLEDIERIPEETGKYLAKQRKVLIERLRKLKGVLDLINKNLRDQRITQHSINEQQKLNRERKELAEKFGVNIKD